jgi:hypothetical protein
MFHAAFRSPSQGWAARRGAVCVRRIRNIAPAFYLCKEFQKIVGRLRPTRLGASAVLPPDCDPGVDPAIHAAPARLRDDSGSAGYSQGLTRKAPPAEYRAEAPLPNFRPRGSALAGGQLDGRGPSGLGWRHRRANVLIRLNYYDLSAENRRLSPESSSWVGARRWPTQKQRFVASSSPCGRSLR